MWKVSWFYEKVHNITNFGGYAAIVIVSWNRNKFDLYSNMTIKLQALI